MTALSQFPLFEDEDKGKLLRQAPNPKPTKRDRAGFGRIASLYTAFSVDFALFALELCISLGCVRIADPFAGMGTTGEAARGLPIKLALNDLSPYAVTSSAFRTATSEEIRAAIDVVNETLLVVSRDPEESQFGKMLAAIIPPNVSIHHCLNSISQPELKRVVLAIHLIGVARTISHRNLKGSNPTWTKRATAQNVGEQTFIKSVLAAIDLAESYASTLTPLHQTFEVSFSFSDVLELDWGKGSIDAIVTSPPYPNRTDYIRHYLPANELLLEQDVAAERQLREAQIGTPLIRPPKVNMRLPASAERLIEAIRTHPSYASESYYVKGFRYYFEDMAVALERFNEWLSLSGVLVIVVQNTYYKEILVPVADILIEMAEASGFKLQERRDFKVKTALSRLSPFSRKSTPKHELSESVLLFRSC
jgi:hypothetical protein